MAAFTKVAGSALRNGAVDSAVGTPNSVGQPEEPLSPKSAHGSRPKPYPTYSRYLIDTQSSVSRASGDHPQEDTGRAVREWLDRSQGDPEDAVELGDEEGGAQLPFMSAAAQSEGVRRNGNGKGAGRREGA